MYHQIEELPFLRHTKKSLIHSSSDKKSINNSLSKQEHLFFPYFPEYFLYRETGGKKHETQCKADAAEKTQREGSSRATVCFQALNQHSSLAVL